MQLLKKLFGTSNSKQSNMQQEKTIENLPGQDLFIDTTPPQKDQSLIKENAIKQFLDSDHYTNGIRASYTLHCHDGMALHLTELRNLFRKALDNVMVVLKNEITEKEILLVQMGEMLPSQKQGLELCLKQIRGTMEETALQKVLSIDEEGVDKFSY